MARPGRYLPDHKGFAGAAVSPEIRAALTEVAEKAKSRAEALAAEFTQSGEYLNAFEISERTVTTGKGHPHRRAAAVLANTSDHATVVEVGHVTKNGTVVPGHRILGRTLDLIGGD